MPYINLIPQKYLPSATPSPNPLSNNYEYMLEYLVYPFIYL